MPAQPPPQSFENHRKIVPGYHFVTFGLLCVQLLWSLWMLWKYPLVGSLVGLGTSVAMLLLFFHARAMALTVQDRVIRLEERMRLERVLEPPLRARIGELSAKQLVAIRFAPDEELPELVAKVLDGKIEDQDAIKRMIRAWRADHLRC